MSGPALPLLPQSDSEPRTGFSAGSVWRHSAANTSSATTIAQIIQGFGGEDALRQSLGEHSLRELQSLSRERTPEIFWSELNQLAGRWSQQNHDDQALTLYGFLSHAIPEQFSEIRNTAVARQNALLGVGESGARLEVLARRFSREATDPVMLASMGGAQAVFGITRLGILSRLGASRSWLTPLLNGRRIAFAGAFAAEGIGFVGIHRGLDSALGRNRGADTGFVHELAGTYLTLGGLRLAGALGTSGFNRLHEVNALTGKIGRFEGLAGWTRPLLQQGATLGGIYLGHSAETWAGLRRPTDGATTFVDSLSTLAQFAVAGRLMHVGLPGIERMTRELELRSEIAAQPRLDSSWLRPEQVHTVLNNVFGTPLLPATVSAGAHGAPETATRPSISDLMHQPMAMSNISEGKGFGGGPGGTGESTSAGESNGGKVAEGERAPDSLPPPSMGASLPTATPTSNPPPSGVRRSKSPGMLVRGLNAFNWTAAKLNLNAFMDTRAPLHAVPVREPAPAVRSIREGMQRAEALGHNRRTLAAIRLGASRLKNLPESQQRFLDLTLGILEFQHRHGHLLDPVLQSIPHPDFAPLNNLARTYREAVTGLTPGSGYYFGQARLLLERVAEWTSVEQYQSLSAAELRAVGIEPDAAKAIERNGHAFSEWDICQILSHPLLRELPESETLRAASRDYQKTLEGILSSIEASKPEIENIKHQMAATESAEERQALEGRKADIAKRVNNAYGRAMLTFNRAMKNFMADPVRARIFLVRTAERSTLIRGLQDWNVEEMSGYVRENLEALPEEVRSKANEFIGASEESALVTGRGRASRMFNGALRIFNLDPHVPLKVQRRLENALVGLVESAPMDFWRFPALPAEAAGKARAAEISYFTERHRSTAELREALAPLEKANDAFWNSHDSEAVKLYLQDLRDQLHQVKGEIARLGDPEVPGGTFSQVHGAELESMLAASLRAIDKYSDPSTRGSNSRDANRALEVALQRNMALENLIRTHLNPEFRLISPLMMPYVEKAGASKRTRWDESFSRIGHLGIHVLLRSAGLISSVAHDETVSASDRHFLNFNSKMTRDGNSEFLVDPNVDYLVEADPVVVPGNHNSWQDFLEGGTPNVRVAQLQGRGTTRDSLRIAAKAGLGKLMGPVIENAIELLTESVADDAPSYDGSVTNLARAMAFGDFRGSRPGPRSSAVYDELTMSVASLIHPYAYDPFPGISSILSAPQGGRSFNIADRASALTGRAQNLLLSSSINSYRIWPKPDRIYPLRRGPIVTATQFMPASAFYDLTYEGRPNGSGRANWLRTYWLHMATVPEHQRGVPSIDAIYRPFEQPAEPEVEAVVARALNSHDEIYPTDDGLRDLVDVAKGLHDELRQSDLSADAAQAKVQALNEINRSILARARENILSNAPLRQRLHAELTEWDARLEEDISNRLGVEPNRKLRVGELLTQLRTRLAARFSDSEAQIQAEEAFALRRYQRILRSRIRLLDRIEAKLANRTPLNNIERRMLEKMAGSYSPVHDRLGSDALLEQLEFYFKNRAEHPNGDHPDAGTILVGIEDLIERTADRDIPQRREIIGLLRRRMNLARRAFSRHRLGIPLSPAEKVLVADLRGSLVNPGSEGPRDGIVELLNQGANPDAAQVSQRLREERIREETRDLIERLPGRGRGTIDPVEESEADLKRVKFNARGEIVGGPEELLTTWPFLAQFLISTTVLGIAGGLDLLTGSRLRIYNAAAHRVASWTDNRAGKRSVITESGIRALETNRIQGATEGRPRALHANHTSWADISLLTEVLPEGRFLYKTSLKYVPGLNLALLGGRHSPIDRPSSKDPDRLARQRERAQRQIADAGARTTRYGTVIETFLPGTRSTTGSVGKAKPGGPSIAVSTNATTLVSSLFGPDQIVPKGTRGYTRGTGTHRRAYLSFSHLDPNAANLPERERERVVRLTQLTQSRIIEMFLEQVADLRRLAAEGDSLAQGQLTQFIRGIEPGMELVRRGRDKEAGRWAEAKKTDPEFLKTFTQWWDAQVSNWHPPRR